MSTKDGGTGSADPGLKHEWEFAGQKRRKRDSGAELLVLLTSQGQVVGRSLSSVSAQARTKHLCSERPLWAPVGFL